MYPPLQRRVTDEIIPGDGSRWGGSDALQGARAKALNRRQVTQWRRRAGETGHQQGMVKGNRRPGTPGQFPPQVARVATDGGDDPHGHDEINAQLGGINDRVDAMQMA